LSPFSSPTLRETGADRGGIGRAGRGKYSRFVLTSRDQCYAIWLFINSFNVLRDVECFPMLNGAQVRGRTTKQDHLDPELTLLHASGHARVFPPEKELRTAIRRSGAHDVFPTLIWSGIRSGSGCGAGRAGIAMHCVTAPRTAHVCTFQFGQGFPESQEVPAKLSLIGNVFVSTAEVFSNSFSARSIIFAV
jgi:hypothetical protein